MKYIVDNRINLSRAPEGPLVTYIEPLARSLRERGYVLDSIHQQVLLAACFSEWLKQRDVALRGITFDQTTKIYTKVDLEALRTLALPWPGGVR